MSLPGAEAAVEADTVAAGPGFVEAVVTSMAFGAVAGTLGGFVWGGVGGRIAMRVLFLTSSENVRGLTSDDGFEIGVISGATIFLLIFTSILGLLAGAVYGLLRMFTAGPRSAVNAGVAVASAAFGGAMIVKSEGIDFVFLKPLWLAVTLFVLIPGLWGATIVPLTERIVRLGASQVGLHPPVPVRGLGLIGWGALIAFTIVGVVDLLADLDRLT